MSDLPTLPLPEHSARLSTAGFKKLYESVRHDPVAARQIADEIEADPRGVLECLFALTKPQKEAIGNTSDAELHRRAKVVVTALRSRAPTSLRFRPHGDKKPPGKDHILSCTCIIDEVSL